MITYLDSGATSQKPIQVIKAVEEFYKKYNANPHRGAYLLSVEATEQYENTRTKIAKFINAKHREEIIFSKNATMYFCRYSAQNVCKGGKTPALLSPPRGNGKYSRAERACRKALQNIFCHFVHHSKKGTACWPRPLSAICERAFFTGSSRSSRSSS